jgi:hypothetical protein
VSDTHHEAGNYVVRFDVLITREGEGDPPKYIIPPSCEMKSPPPHPHHSSLGVH